MSSDQSLRERARRRQQSATTAVQQGDRAIIQEQGPSGEERRRLLAEQFSREFETEVAPEDLEARADEFNLSDAALRREGVAQLQPETESQIDTSDIQQTGGGFGLTEQAQRQEGVAQLQPETQVSLLPEDIALEGQGFALTEPAQRQEAVTGFQGETDIQVTGQDVVLSDDGVTLSESAQRQEALQDIQPETQTDISTADLEATESGFGLTESAQRQEAVAQFQPETSIQIGTGDIQQTESGFGLVPEVRRQEAFQDLQSETQTDISQQDITETGGGFGLTETAQRQEAAAQSDIFGPGDFTLSGGTVEARQSAIDRERQEGRQEAIQQLDQETQTDITSGDVTERGGGLGLTTAARREEAVASLQGDTQTQIDAGDLQRSGGGFALEPQALREEAATQSDLFGPADFRVQDGTAQVRDAAIQDARTERRADAIQAIDEQTQTDITGNDITQAGDGFGLTRSAQREEVAASVDEQFGSVDISRSDLEFGAVGLDFQLNPAVREEIAANRAGGDFDVDVSAGDVDITRAEERSPFDVAEIVEQRASRNTQEAIQEFEQRSGMEFGAGNIESFGPQGVQLDLGPMNVFTPIGIEDTVSISESVQREQAVTQLQGETQTEIGPSDIALSDSGVGLTQQAQKQEAVAELQGETDTQIDTGDITESGGTFGLTDQTLREEAAQDIQADVPQSQLELIAAYNEGADIPQQFDVTGSGDVGREDVVQLIGDQQQFEAAQAAVPEFSAEDITLSAPIESREQLVQQFTAERDIPEAFDVTDSGEVARQDIVQLIGDEQTFEQAQSQAIEQQGFDIGISQEARRRETVEAFDVQTPFDVTAQDLQFGDSPQLTDEALRETTAAQSDVFGMSDLAVREQGDGRTVQATDTALVESAAAQSDVFGVADLQVTQQDGERTVEATQDAQIAQVFGGLQEETEAEIDESDIVFTDAGAQLTDRALRLEAGAQSPEFNALDFLVSGEGDERSVELRESAGQAFREREIAERLRQDTGADVRTSDVNTVSGLTLSDEALVGTTAAQSDIFGLSDLEVTQQDGERTVAVTPEAQEEFREQAQSIQEQSQLFGDPTERQADIQQNIAIAEQNQLFRDPVERQAEIQQDIEIGEQAQLFRDPLERQAEIQQDIAIQAQDRLFRDPIERQAEIQQDIEIAEQDRLFGDPIERQNRIRRAGTIQAQDRFFEDPADIQEAETDLEAQINQGQVPSQFAGAVTDVQRQGAEVFSERLGFDVPESAVDVDVQTGPTGRVFSPELDTERVREAGRTQGDIFSGAVETFEDLDRTERAAIAATGPVGITVAAGREIIGEDVPGEGSVRNVRAVEQFEGEGEITGTLPEGIDERLSGASQAFSENVSTPFGDFVGDAIDLAQASGRMRLAADPLAAGATPLDPFGGSRQIDRSEEFAGTQERVRDLTRAPDAEVSETTAAERFAQGGATTAAEIANIPGFASAGFTGLDIAATGARRTIEEGGPGGFAQDLFGQATLTGAEATETAIENPVTTTGAITGGVISGVGAGALGKRAFTSLRGRLSTRGMRFQGEVDIEDIERPDVRSGESTLTRFSERAVPPENRVTGVTDPMDVDDFPATPASTTSQELRNLAREFDDPQIRRALGADVDESVLFTARSGVKGERFTPRSGRAFDPDAAFFSGSVARNFLDIPDSTDAGILSGGIRRPRPLEATRSLVSAARQQDTPVIVGTAGQVRMFPENIVSARTQRPAMTQFLRERANTGEFFTLRPEAGSAEAEALTAAEGAVDTPLLGSGVLSADEATEFVEVARPFSTEIRGERVPIQLFRQDTGDVTPLSEQRSATGRLGFGFDERGQVDLTGTDAGDAGRRVRRTTRTSDSIGDSSPSFTPGGRPGTPVAPNLFGVGGRRTEDTETDAEAREPVGDFRSGMARPTSDRDGSAFQRDSDSTSPFGSGVGSTFSGGFASGFSSPFGGLSRSVSQPGPSDTDSAAPSQPSSAFRSPTQSAPTAPGASDPSAPSLSEPGVSPSRSTTSAFGSSLFGLGATSGVSSPQQTPESPATSLFGFSSTPSQPVSEPGSEPTSPTVSSPFGSFLSQPGSPTPSPEPSPQPSPTPSPQPSPMPEPSPTPSPEPSPEPSPQPSPGPSPFPSPFPTPSPSPSPEPTPGPAPTQGPGTPPPPPTTTPFSTPNTPARPDAERDRGGDDDEEPFVLPEGTLFENPVVSGGGLIGLGGGQQSAQGGAEGGLFGGDVDTGEVGELFGIGGDDNGGFL